jgi:hypothetical protein
MRLQQSQEVVNGGAMFHALNSRLQQTPANSRQLLQNTASYFSQQPPAFALILLPSINIGRMALHSSCPALSTKSDCRDYVIKTLVVAHLSAGHSK